MAHPLAEHARTSIRAYLSGEPAPNYPGTAEAPRGVFVSLHIRAGDGEILDLFIRAELGKPLGMDD